MTRTLMITIDAASEDLYRQAENRVLDSLKYLPVDVRMLPSPEEPMSSAATVAIQRIVNNPHYQTWPHRDCGEQ